jgi:hypothetical protein
MFVDRYHTFWLSQAAHVRLPGGEPCFPGVPERSPQQILAAHGLQPAIRKSWTPPMMSASRRGGASPRAIPAHVTTYTSP